MGSNLGVKAPYWFWGCDAFKKSNVKEDEQEDATQSQALHPVAENKNPETEILELIAGNPDMNVSTFYNLLKTKGFVIAPPMDGASKTTEADSASANAQAVRAGTNESLNKESNASAANGNVDFKCRFVESAARDNGVGFTKYSVVLLQEGMGNPKDAFYYHRDALMSAVPVFEGKKIYADHPSLIEEQTRPERSVRDVLGHFENVRLEESEGRAVLKAEVVTLPDEPYRWARALMRHAVDYSTKYPDKEFVGLSINASGDARPMSIDKLIESGIPDAVKPKLLKAQAAGVDQVKVVTKLEAAVSCDLVTEAGAGGMILEMLEGEKNMGKKINLADDKVVDTNVNTSVVAVKEADKKGECDDKKKEAGGEKHDDKAQDIELIKKLLTDYGVTDADEGQLKMGQEAMEAAKAMGLEGDEAMKCAGYSLKMAKHMAGKQAEAQKQADTPQEAAAVTPQEADKKPVTDDSAKKESNEIIKLTAENAKLKESLLKYELSEHTDAVLRESGFPMRVTKAFKEKIKESKSKKEIDEKFELFKEAYGVAGGEAKNALNFFVQPEKSESQMRESSKKIDLSGCIN